MHLTNDRNTQPSALVTSEDRDTCPQSPDSVSQDDPQTEPLLNGYNHDECSIAMDPSLLQSPHHDRKRPSRSWRETIHDRSLQALSFCLTIPVLTVFTTIALFDTAKRRHNLRHEADAWTEERLQQEHRNPGEQITQDDTYYAQRWGYQCHTHQAITKDGHILKMYRFGAKNKPMGQGPPVLLCHGLFQASGAFVLNEESSMAFVLVDQGYDVWTGNNRAVAGFHHLQYEADQVEYWDWGLKELGLYDIPAMLDHIRTTSGHSRVALIGHSQGNAQVFIALSQQPELADKMSCFIALAPAVVAGHLTHRFPLRWLIQLDEKPFRILFGRKAFIGIMTVAQKLLPANLMQVLAYSMFSYLFEWWDHHWIQRRKIKYFQFTPRPVSTRLLLDWMLGWGQKGVCRFIKNRSTDVDAQEQKLYAQKTIPLVVVYGTDDYLVDGAAFVRSFEGYDYHAVTIDDLPLPRYSFSFPTLKLAHVERIPGYEHMDCIWGFDNTETTYPLILNTLQEKARWT
ncbi:alpha/beta-hydrolase [Hesseltinella vesiculosa]|uniref:Alpha/beta-hydrolase n=1 Tax=Hesseltinella vesiculosa TaxID=101127 RepID=A0A1X2GAL9_9FUNG|nr:alpha/beta-hydrolase [Hesseltinella vesiculosa]